jgi:hypothetical protein
MLGFTASSLSLSSPPLARQEKGGADSCNLCGTDGEAWAAGETMLDDLWKPIHTMVEQRERLPLARAAAEPLLSAIRGRHMRGATPIGGWHFRSRGR